MRRPLSLLPALVTVAATTVVGLAPGSSVTAAAAPPETDPLQVEIDSLTPSTVPVRGPIRLRGTVTNVSEERWRAINVHAFVGGAPLTSAAELAAAVQTPVDAFVGDRITEPGTFDDIGSLAPGETASFSIRLSRDQLPVSAPGVYWFGAHALGNTDAARDSTADGRARTFLPLVPASTRGSVEVALAAQVRRPVRHGPAGRVVGVPRWADDLAPGGALDRLVDFGSVPGAGPVTWLVDPAVPDAVARLVAGNPPRSLSDTIDPEEGDGGGDQGGGEETGDTGTPAASTTGPGDEESPTDDETDEPAGNVAEPGAAWLEALRDVLTGSEVLTLPYGDLDIAGAAASDPGFYDIAAGRAGNQIGRWGLATSPTVSSPRGFLAPQVTSVLHGDETVIVSDRVLDADEPVTSAEIDGHEVLVASSATALGGPGPEDRLGEIAMRQRVLADAALRLLFHDGAPLLVLLPPAWQPAEPREFWSGLAADWLEVTDVSDLEDTEPGSPPEPIPADDLAYPVEQELRELDAAGFEAARDLVDAGRTLETLLTNNDMVATQVMDEALTSLSYGDRDRALAARTATVRATGWIDRKLHGVRIRAPRGVTLSSSSGSFAATLVNRLNHPVTVAIDPVSQGAVTVEEPPTVELAARGRQTVPLEASASRTGVHYVRLRVTDESGTPLGAAQRVPIRSTEASAVIWLILGVGVGLLFLAIAVRVVRRIRSERA